jgi:hypothetical protein
MGWTGEKSVFWLAAVPLSIAVTGMILGFMSVRAKKAALERKKEERVRIEREIKEDEARKKLDY